MESHDGTSSHLHDLTSSPLRRSKIDKESGHRQWVKRRREKPAASTLEFCYAQLKCVVISGTKNYS